MTHAFEDQLRHDKAKLTEALKAAEDELGPLRQDNQTLRAKLAAAEAELAALHAGEEPVDVLGLHMTAGQWIAAWNAATPAERLQGAQRILDMCRQAAALPAAEEPKLTARYIGPPVQRCPSCRDAEHRAMSCEEAEAARRPWRDWLDDAYKQAIEQACDHRDPKRLGARPSDLATVCACGEVVAPSPLPFGPGTAGSYTDQVNAPLRPETAAAISRALKEGAAPRRKVPRQDTKSGPSISVSAEDLTDWSLTSADTVPDSEDTP